MIKWSLIFCFLFIGFSASKAQPIIEKLEYESDKKRINAFAFKIPQCNKAPIIEEWKALVKANGGSFKLHKEIFDRYQADGVQFEDFSGYGYLKLYFEVFPHVADSLIVTNAFQYDDLTFVDRLSNSQDARLSLKTMEDFSLNVRKACVNDEIDQARTKKEILIRERVGFQNELGRLSGSVTHSHTKIIKLEREEKSLKGQMKFYERKLGESIGSSLEKKLSKELNRVKNKFDRIQGILLKEKANIDESILLQEINRERIKATNEQIRNQELVIKELETKLSLVKR